MTNENELLQKLMISRKIMEKHNEIPRNHSDGQVLTAPMVESFSPVNANYNIPQEIVQENSVSTKPAQYVNSQEKIMSSKLPDAIKQLMIEHPIHQPNTMAGPTLSDDLVEKAARLMNGGKEVIKETTTQKRTTVPTTSTPDNKEFRKMLKEVVKEVLSENGMLVESVSKSNDNFSFKVGKHIFEGKVTKIKKIS
jgi:hypothetical protein